MHFIPDNRNIFNQAQVTAMSQYRNPLERNELFFLCNNKLDKTSNFHFYQTRSQIFLCNISVARFSWILANIPLNLFKQCEIPLHSQRF